MFSTIKLEITNKIAYLILNRPELKNAVNSLMIEELHLCIDALIAQNNFEILIITGSGNTFCSGADLNWLIEVSSHTYDENYDESFRLIELLYKIKEFPKPVIAKINGSAVGAGVGIMLSCDIIYAIENAKFGLSEVNIGIVPAAIINFVIERIGLTKAKEILLTGNRINAIEAERIGLINKANKFDELDLTVDLKINELLKNGLNAMKVVKEMINKVQFLSKLEIFDYVATTVAELRLNSECQEGITSFLEKREPNWRK
jgi:methylglutaconyl-CoA hydratase